MVRKVVRADLENWQVAVDENGLECIRYGTPIDEKPENLLETIGNPYLYCQLLRGTTPD